jgi:hypothetical protein
MLSSSFCYIHPLLEIPDNVQRKIFRDVSLSVLAFLQFPLPNISGAAPQHDASKFFSDHDPNMKDIKEIQKVPVPPAKTVAELVTACKTAVASGTKSIKCLHVPSRTGQNLPMWIIAYWAEVLELRITSRKVWVKAEEFLRQRKKPWKKSVSGEIMDEVMQEAYNVLSCLPWSGIVCGFDDHEPLHTIATYTSRAWFSTLHENQMLDLLRRDLLLKGSNVEIGKMAFFQTLQEAYNHRETGEYDESRHFAHAWSIGQALETGERGWAWYYGAYQWRPLGSPHS